MSDCPAPTDAEVHVFGPGYGECVLVHIGCGEWIVVDSCTLSNREPAAIDWLSKIGVDPSSAVKLVVATHWHDDHVRGLAKTFAACENATFACSNALLSEELATLARDAHRAQMRSSSGLDELRKIIQELQQRNSKATARTLGTGLELASANMRLFRRADGPPCEVWSLSPSSAEIEASLRQFCSTLAKQENPTARNRVVPCGPNNASVVLWLSIGSRRILLGADLEERRSSNCGSAAPDAGWTAIVTSTRRPSDPAELFKLPHHGSATAHNDDVWSTMVSNEPIAVLSPFRNGNVSLPNAADCARILEKTPLAYVSAQAARRRYKPANKVESWALTGKHATTAISPGHVWLRASAETSECNWTVILQDGACAMQDFVAV